MSGDTGRFRAEVRRFLAEPRVRDAVVEIARYPAGREPALLDIYRWLGERGWLAADWPTRYGGADLGPTEAAVVTEEMGLAGVPDDLHVLSIDLVGAFVLRHGSDAQRAAHLPALARGERMATVLFTEPEAGSDLAALRTRAEPDGDGWRLTGSKIYNQKSQFAEVALCAARTTESPVPFHGITLFLLPLRSAGVHIETVPGIGNDQFTLVVIDGVRLTADDVVGRPDDGWQLINELLLRERTGIDFHAKTRRQFELLVRQAAATGALDDPAYADRLADLDARLRAGHALAWEMVADLARGEPDPVRSAMAKWFVTEQVRDVMAAAGDGLGLDLALSAWDGEAPQEGLLEAAYRASPTQRLASGTSEIMLYLIATSGLELQ
ncbi:MULTISPECIES: acyl-CoA dehydrogenase family protein [Micromonospora]|uniref:Acyl-CoA dehydrogenase n=1 Tax=Micromonospora yangpuensis TaxID=683228 RepID=A0A1C6VI45_9ACTN|nr:acyl-CoA dehydrogenase family protein [Micromonospora yangpuensis]GGL99315.1 acyl-CoA dehydrogenase [Micromonospora yangpuensis]SCL65560.1 Acyl-CoA dehydrogenase [Micromonospora yangpuensis]